MIKKCGRCLEHKPLEQFNKSKSGALGHHGHCRACQRIVKRLHYEMHRDEAYAYAQHYQKSDKAKAARKQYYAAHREQMLERNRIRRSTPEARLKANITRKKHYYSDISFRIACNLRSRIRQALRKLTKSASTAQLTGCDLNELKAYITAKFQTGMTWENYGYYGWHIDHIRPCDSFDLSDPAQQRTCFHYTNLQPLWRSNNQSKNAKWNPIVNEG